MRRMFPIGVVAVATVGWGQVARGQETPRWDRLQLLLGTWDTKGDTQLGQAEGSTSFTRELNGQVIVRKSFASYPQSGSRHDDLLVVYRDDPNAAPRAIYFDSEGHVIRYSVTTPTDDSVVFESETSDRGPRFRLSYTRSSKSTLKGVFEIAAPGAEYKTYLSWTSTPR